ncbi:hypothetical protein RJ639_026942, partial [Escallonia herrerae]
SLVSTVSNDEQSLSSSAVLPLPLHGVAGNLWEVEREYWPQPDGEGYLRAWILASIKKGNRRASQMRGGGSWLWWFVTNQIVPLWTRLSMPGFLKPLWLCLFSSDISDIFDIEHFKTTLRADVRVVSSLPCTHLVSTQTIDNQIPFDVSPLWIRARFFKQLNEEGPLVLKGLDSKLSKNSSTGSSEAN